MTPSPMLNQAAEYDIHVIILNWNQLPDTTECLQSLLKQREVCLHYTIVDNGSTDSSVPELKKLFPGIEIIENPRNLGFGGGFNIGFDQVLRRGAKLIFMLNNDTIADPMMLRILMDHMTEPAILSPLIFFYAEPEKIWSSGGDINPVLLEMPPFARTNALSSQAPIRRDFLTGCALLISREVLERIGTFDNRFFPIYYEDLDFCLRAKKAGFKAYLIPQAKLWHKVSASSGGLHNPRERYLIARNSGFYFRKYMQAWQIPIILPFRLVSALRWTIRLLLKKDFRALSSYWRGLYDGWIRPVGSSS